MLDNNLQFYITTFRFKEQNKAKINDFDKSTDFAQRMYEKKIQPTARGKIDGHSWPLTDGIRREGLTLRANP